MFTYEDGKWCKNPECNKYFVFRDGDFCSDRCERDYNNISLIEAIEPNLQIQVIKTQKECISLKGNDVAIIYENKPINEDLFYSLEEIDYLPHLDIRMKMYLTHIKKNLNPNFIEKLKQIKEKYNPFAIRVFSLEVQRLFPC